LLLLLLQATEVATLSGQGAEAMRTRRFTEAAKIYRHLATVDAANPMWHLNLAMALQSSGELRAALAEFGVFLKAKPEPGPAHFLLGLTHLKLDQPCEAVAPLEAARRWKASVQVLVELGDAYHGCKRWDQAAAAYSEALRLTPGDRRLARQSARCWWLARRYDKAKLAYAGLTAKFGAEPEFQYEYGDTLVRLQGAAAGLPWLQKAVEAAPGMLAARGALGRALVELGRAADALPHLEAARGEDPAVLLPLSRAYRSVGRATDAAEAEAEYKRRIAQ
jgi:tetratricopeptide (TPR) repeat protein